MLFKMTLAGKLLGHSEAAMCYVVTFLDFLGTFLARETCPDKKIFFPETDFSHFRPFELAAIQLLVFNVCIQCT